MKKEVRGRDLKTPALLKLTRSSGRLGISVPASGIRVRNITDWPTVLSRCPNGCTGISNYGRKNYLKLQSIPQSSTYLSYRGSLGLYRLVSPHQCRCGTEWTLFTDRRSMATKTVWNATISWRSIRATAKCPMSKFDKGIRLYHWAS